MRRFALRAWPALPWIATAIVLAIGCQSDFNPIAPSPKADLALASDDLTSCNGLVPTIVGGSTSPPASSAIYGTPSADVIVGTDLPDSIYGAGGDDTICGLGGGDWIFGDDGNDTVHGNAGADSLYGGIGNDTISGDEDDDFLVGGDGVDRLFGGSGNDQLEGVLDPDYLDGGEGNDAVHGGIGADSLFGGSGDDVIHGGADADFLDGGPGVDLLYGSNGTDYLLGGADNDQLFGDANADYLDGGEGTNKLDGGKEVDSCVPRADRLIRCEIFPNPPEPPPPPPPPPDSTDVTPGDTTRPNFLVIITDDQRYDDFQGTFMPITYQRIAQQGVEFTRGYATTPLCCPSRSSIYTGMYARHHGVTANPTPLIHPTVTQALHNSGYTTAMIGKYLNSWGGSPRPEYDYWASWGPNGGSYYNPYMNVNGVQGTHNGYVTHVIRDLALQFLDSPASRNSFVLFFAGPAPHSPSTPAPGDENRYQSLPPFRPPNFNEADISDKPAWIPGSPIPASKVKYIDTVRRNMLATMWSTDQAIGAILDKLEVQGRLDRTVVILISDNGFMMGEHRIYDRKNLLYEETARVPFAIRYPPLIPGPRVENALVANIDIAPTLYELAGLPIPASVDGKSLVPLLQSGTPLRQDLLLEAWESPTAAPSIGLRTDQYMYIERAGFRSELYDMVADPYQLQNRADDPTYAAILADIRARLSTY